MTRNRRSLLCCAMLLRSGLVPLRLAVAVFVALSLAGCWKKRGEAIVVAKEHIDVAEIKPSPSPGASPTRPKMIPNTMKLLVYGPVESAKP